MSNLANQILEISSFRSVIFKISSFGNEISKISDFGNLEILPGFLILELSSSEILQFLKSLRITHFGKLI